MTALGFLLTLIAGIAIGFALAVNIQTEQT